MRCAIWTAIRFRGAVSQMASRTRCERHHDVGTIDVIANRQIDVWDRICLGRDVRLKADVESLERSIFAITTAELA